MPSSRPRERFTVPELAEVLRRSTLGAVEKVTEFGRGSSRSPKLVVTAQGRRWLLKRRAPANRLPGRIEYCQGFQRFLAGARLPVPAPRPFADGRTCLELEGGSYEIFEFVEASRWSRTPQEARSAGRMMGLLHARAEGYGGPGDPAHGSYHASELVLGALCLCEESIPRADPAADPDALTVITSGLRRAYREAAETVMELGLRTFLPQAIHGDYHPGNLLWREGDVAAVLDFDSAREEPRVVDWANAVLQHGAPSLAGLEPAAWPGALDPVLVEALAAGLRSAANRPDPLEWRMVPWLMIESCISECAVPIANRGAFADVRGMDFLAFTERRVQWLRREAPSIVERCSQA